VTGSPRRIIKKLVCASLLGLAIGFILGYVGSWVEHRNESRFGASYSQFEFEWVGFFTLPGRIITQEFVHTHDWSVDEAWHYRVDISLWNALVWCVAIQLTAGIHSVVTAGRPMSNGAQEVN
jgi:hypothetical protein